MITYQKINKHLLEKWNVKLFETDASYFQYPYYCSGYEYMPNSSCEHFTINLNEAEIAFVSILNVKVGFLKIGLIIRGPVILQKNSDYEIIKGLQQIQKKENYFLLRINPNITDLELETHLKNNRAIIEQDSFPIYKGSQDRDFIIELEKDEEKLLASYKTNARRKIKYAKEDEFTYSKVKTIDELDNVYNLFKSVSNTKGFKFRSQNSYKAIIEQGLKHGLCDVYCAHYQNKLVNAIIIMKDKNTNTHHSSALIQEGYNIKNAPAAYLHHMAIVDANNENKKYYNISFSDESSPVFQFKILFNPKEVKFPSYYTITSSKALLEIFLIFTRKIAPMAKKLIRKKHGNR